MWGVIYTPPTTGPSMATPYRTAKVQNTMHYFNNANPQNDMYIDVAEGLSRVNRKLFSQEYAYTIKNIKLNFVTNAIYDELSVQIITAGDTWPVHNAWVKAKALYDEMQELVLDDNPSIEGKWADFKVYLDPDHKGGAQFAPIDHLGAHVLGGEWDHSTFVMPQHEVDAAGVPLPAVELTGHLVGEDTATGRGLVQAYQDSRATVQTDAPNVPIAFEDSFFNLLTDSGSQEPELAAVIIDENDEPPYRVDAYPGSATNVNRGYAQHRQVVNVNSPNLVIPSFVAQCGLIHMRIQASLGGIPVGAPFLGWEVEVASGNYKGVKAQPMGQ